jgi:hypothetical protein
MEVPMRGARVFFPLAVAVAVGCASETGKAEDGKAPSKEPDAKKKPETRGGKVERRFQAKVLDRYKTPPVLLSDVVLFVPDVSIFGGTSGETQRELVVKRGGHEITVPFVDVLSIEVPTEEKEDRIEVVVRFRDPKLSAKELRGTVRSNLELRGGYEGGKLEAKIKLRDVRSLELEEMPREEAPAPASKPGAPSAPEERK